MDVFDDSRSRSAGFAIKKWGLSNFWLDEEDMINKIDLCEASLHGLVAHRPGHWISHRLQSYGTFAELDSNVNFGAAFEAAEQPHRTTAKLVSFALHEVKAGHAVFLLFKNPVPRWKKRKAVRTVTDDGLSEFELSSDGEPDETDAIIPPVGKELPLSIEPDDTDAIIPPVGKQRPFSVYKSHGYFEMSLRRRGAMLVGYTLFYRGQYFLKGPLVSCDKRFTTMERIAYATFQKAYEELVYNETRSERFRGYDNIESQKYFTVLSGPVFSERSIGLM